MNARALLLACLCVPTAEDPTCEAAWQPAFGPAADDYETGVSLVFDDGTGPALYVGGRFDTMGGVAANSVAKWDGASWSALGPGLGALQNQGVNALAAFDAGAGPALYAGGNFTSITGGAPEDFVARWDGAAWTALGTGVDQRVDGLLPFDDGTGSVLFVFGAFQTVGGLPSPSAARWDGAGWLPASPAGVLSSVRAMAVHDDGSGPALYAGGVGGIARWDGAGWVPVGAPPIAAVSTLVSFDPGTGPELWAGGFGLWRPDGAGGWTNLLPGQGVTRATVWDDGAGSAVWVGWADWTFGEPWGVVRCDGAGCVEAAPDLPILVQALTPFDDGSGERLHASGGAPLSAWFASETPSHTWARDGADWTPLEPGFDGRVLDLATVPDGSGGETLYASGQFLTAGTAIVPRVAAWDGSSWSAVGDPAAVVYGVTALAGHDDGSGPALHAAGTFQLPGAGSVRVVKWDGATWEPVGGDLPLAVNALASFDDGSGAALYLGAGGSDGLRVWDGAVWAPVGGGLAADVGPASVTALQVWDDGGGPALYVGGTFDRAGGQPAKNVARWDGAGWSALGAGTAGPVRALAVLDDGSGSVLCAGGSFTNAGGLAVPAESVACWDGTSWSALGAGIASGPGIRVNALAPFDEGAGPVLFAGGSFTTAGGSPAPYVARWDGSSWSSVGGGVEDVVHAFAVSSRGPRPELFVGGQFLSTIADGQTLLADDAYLGRWAQPCDGPVPYCQAKTSSGGCVASIGSAGAPSLTGPDDFRVTASGVPGLKPGLMFWGQTKSALPFFGGTLCVIPVTRTPVQFSNGTSPAACDGAYDYPWTQAYFATFGVAPGTQLYAQYWFRDPGFPPPNDVGLSNGLAFSVLP